MNKLEQAVLDSLRNDCTAQDGAIKARSMTGAAMTAAFGTAGTKKADDAFSAFRKAHLQVSGEAGINDLMEANKGKSFADLDADGQTARMNRVASMTWSNLKPTSARSKAKSGKAKAKAKAGKAGKNAAPSLATMADSPAELQKALRAFANRVQGLKDNPYADSLGLVAALQVCVERAKAKAKAK